MKLLWKIALFVLFVSLATAKDAEKSDVDTANNKNKDVKEVLPEADESLKEEVVDEEDDEEKKWHKHPNQPGLLQKISQKLGLADKKPFENIHNLLKPKPKPTITVTKTLTLEVTKQVTRHPYCISSPKGQKPCVPYKKPQSHNHHGGKSESVDEEEEPEVEDLREEGVYVESTASVKAPEAVAAKSLDDSEQPLWEPVGIAPENVKGYESLVEAPKSLDESELTRSKRYISFSGETPSIEVVKSGIDESAIIEDAEAEEVDETGRFLFRRAVTKTLTSTMWVTKVQKVTDYRVTATLAAQNCYPSGLNIPKCGHY